MTLVFEVLGVICAAVLIRAVSARAGTGSLRGWLACVAVGLGALTPRWERRHRSLAMFYLVVGVG